jgi:adenine-specific DNA-methyltransferase
MAKKKSVTKKTVETLTHSSAKRLNLPSAEHEAVMSAEDRSPIRVAIERRNRDLDPQLVWRGKDEQDQSDLVVSAPPLYIQERVHPKALIDDLLRDSSRRQKAAEAAEREPLLFADMYEDFNGVPDHAKGAEFYQHDANWTNRMILGDSLQVMASLAEREGLRGQVQCIYFDPPYGIKFNSNFQWSTTSRDVKDGKASHITREPEQVKAFRDTWRDGINSYLSYLRDRLVAARDLLHETGSIFVQIGDENVHRVRCLIEEIFGEENAIATISFVKTTGQTDSLLASVTDHILWYARSKGSVKYRQPYSVKQLGEQGASGYTRVETASGFRRSMTAAEKASLAELPSGSRVFTTSDLTSQSPGSRYDITLDGQVYYPKGYWKTEESSMPRLIRANRITKSGNSVRYVRYLSDFAAYPLNNAWNDTGIAGFASEKRYIVETSTKVVERCLLMASDPGDLVLDPTCGSGTSAFVAEQWGRRWITIDTSRVSLALARSRIMGARYPYYILADSLEGQKQEAQLSRLEPSSLPAYMRVRQGFVYERVPHITLKSIANNAEIDTIWDKYQPELEQLRIQINNSLSKSWEDWEIPLDVDAKWDAVATKLHSEWWDLRNARQREIDASIAAKADNAYLYDKPYEDKLKVRVAGPFTVESLSPHRNLAVGADDELIDPLDESKKSTDRAAGIPDFVTVILENLGTAGVQQAHKDDRIEFTSMTPWPGDYVCAEGRYQEGDSERRAAIFIGPEFGTVSRSDLAAAAREAAEAGFDVLVSCAFSYEAHASEFNKLGSLPVLKARMNADLHMAGDLANTGKGNLFVIFGEPDIEFYVGGTKKLDEELLRRSENAKQIQSRGKKAKLSADEKSILERCSIFEERASQTEEGQVFIEVRGVDVFDPSTGEVRSDSADGIACWMIDDDYNEESFFVRHAYFLGQNDPYKALKTTLKAEIDEEAWSSLNSDTSRPFDKPKSGRIAVKVINHLGDEVMKVFRVE